jgi:hypothetical protein
MSNELIFLPGDIVQCDIISGKPILIVAVVKTYSVGWPPDVPVWQVWFMRSACERHEATFTSWIWSTKDWNQAVIKLN